MDGREDSLNFLFLGELRLIISRLLPSSDESVSSHQGTKTVSDAVVKKEKDSLARQGGK